ncbi:MAG: AEC family transporter [Betaproteobacteria bacterium]|nr:AEC family transporter [Betaproteobacteria bacterium]
MIMRIVGIILPVFGMVLLGYLYGRKMRPTMATVNHLSINVLAPALVFSALAAKEFELAASGGLILGSIGVVLGSGLLAWPFVRALDVQWRTFLPPMMFNNCGNMGLPLAALAYGAKGLSMMVALFTVSNLLHFTLGTYMVSRDAHFGRVFKSPIVIATFLGFLFGAFHWSLPVWAMAATRMVGEALIPLMLISLGVRMVDVSWAGWRLGLIGGIVCPLTGIAMAVALGPLLGLGRDQWGMLVLFGSLPPAVLNFMVAEQYHQEPEKVASVVLIGNMLSVVFVTVGLTLALGATS